MPVGFLRGGAIDIELRDSIVEALRHGPHEFQELFRYIREVLDRPGLRPPQLQPVILRLSDRGLVTVTGRGGNKTVALTLRGHEFADRIGAGEEAPEIGDNLLKLRFVRQSQDEIDDEGRRQMARIVARACAGGNLAEPQELADLITEDGE